MYILDWFTRFIFLPGIVFLIILFIPEAIKDIREWRRTIFGADGMVDEKLRAKMEQAFSEGRMEEALELSRTMDIQILETMKSWDKNTPKSKIPSVASTEYRILKQNY